MGIAESVNLAKSAAWHLLGHSRSRPKTDPLQAYNLKAADSNPAPQPNNFHNPKATQRHADYPTPTTQRVRTVSEKPSSGTSAC